MRRVFTILVLVVFTVSLLIAGSHRHPVNESHANCPECVLAQQGVLPVTPVIVHTPHVSAIVTKLFVLKSVLINGRELFRQVPKSSPPFSA